MTSRDQLLALLADRIGPSLTRGGGGFVGDVAVPTDLLVAGAVHEFHPAAAADGASAAAFTLCAASMAASARTVLVVRQDGFDGEEGALNPRGLSELGLAPDRLVLVKARDAEAVLRAGLDGARCDGLGAVVMALWGEPRMFDLTASRRLALAAQDSGVTVFLQRFMARQEPNAVATRWEIAAAPSRPLAGHAPGPPCFGVHLVRSRQAHAGRRWIVEWNRERRSFEEPGTGDRAALSRPVAAASVDRPSAPGAADRLRRAG